MFKYTKYLLVIILVACSSGSKEIDFQESAINAVKNELLNPDSFELIKYSLDTIFLRNNILLKIKMDSFEIKSAEVGLETWKESYSDAGKDYYNKYLVQLEDAENRIDSNLSLINSVPDSIFEYRGNIRYYANRKGGMRVINEMFIYFDYKGIVVNTINLDR